MVQNSSDEEWDMVSDSVQAEALDAATTTTEAEEETPKEFGEAPWPSASASVEEEGVREEKEGEAVQEFLSLEEQQQRAILNATSPEEIQKLLDESTFESAREFEVESVNTKEEEEDDPLSSKEEETNHKAAAEETKPAAKTSPTQPTPSTPNLPGWLRASLGAATKVLQEADQRHQLQQKTRQGLTSVGSSLRQVGSVVSQETQEIRSKVTTESRRLSQTVQQKADELQWTAGENISKGAKTVAEGVEAAGETISQKTKTASERISQNAKTASVKIKQGAQVAGEKVQELNKDGTLTQVVAAAAVVGAGLFLAAKGKPGASAAVFATGGAAYAAQECAGRQYDEGLNEELHMD